MNALTSPRPTPHGSQAAAAPRRVGDEPTDASTEPDILCTDLVRIFTAASVEVQALQGLTLTVERGELVAVVGASGSGKSTAAVRLGNRLGLPVHLVDEEIGWLPGWVERPVDEQRELATALAAANAWVLDSAYGSWLDRVLARTDLVVALDYPRLLGFARLTRRSLRRVVTGTESCNGNVETWRRLVAQDSILRWHVRSYARKRDRMRAWEADPGFVPVLRLTHPRQLRQILHRLGQHRDE